MNDGNGDNVENGLLQGKVVQLASPREILEHPKTEFVRKLVQRKDDFL